MGKAQKTAIVGRDCVACGCCITACPKTAIHIHLGMFACVDAQKCIGCGKCAKICPAAIITIAEQETEE